MKKNEALGRRLVFRSRESAACAPLRAEEELRCEDELRACREDVETGILRLLTTTTSHMGGRAVRMRRSKRERDEPTYEELRDARVLLEQHRCA